MKNKLFSVVFVGFSLFFGANLLASGNYKVTCDDTMDIFESPMEVVITGKSATVQTDFSGPGDAIFLVDYKNLRVDSLRTNSDGEIESVEVELAKVTARAKNFSLSLKASGHDKLEGRIEMTSTDEDQMPYHGDVTCTVK